METLPSVLDGSVPRAHQNETVTPTLLVGRTRTRIL